MVDSIGLKRVNSPCRRGLFFLSLRPLLFDFTRKGKVDIKECVNVDVTVWVGQWLEHDPKIHGDGPHKGVLCEELRLNW